MAKQSTVAKTPQEKCDYYSKRVNNPKLSDGQRRWAQKRLNELCGGGKPNKTATSSASKTNTSGNYGNFTPEQRAAYNAGIGYGAAKAGARVPVKDENKQSFRNGLDRGKRLKK